MGFWLTTEVKVFWVNLTVGIQVNRSLMSLVRREHIVICLLVPKQFSTVLCRIEFG